MLIAMDLYRHYSLVFFAIALHLFALSSQRRPYGRSLSSQTVHVVVFNVVTYGAKGDGKSYDTKAFEDCWREACKANVSSAAFLVPEGYSFMIQSLNFTGPCRNSQLVFQINGKLVAPDGPGSWTSDQKLYWLMFDRIDGMTMEGGGLIDGKGEEWWKLPCKPHKGKHGTTLPGPCESPYALMFVWCSNLRLQNLNIIDGQQKHFWFDNCRDVNIDSLYITSPADSPNTDGIHLHNSKDVNIHNSVIACGDDCVSIGGGTHNVDIRNLSCGPGHGISIGSLGVKNSRECVSNITVTDSILKNTDNGVRIKTIQGGSGSVTGVTFDQICMENVRNPILISQYYSDGAAHKSKNKTSAVYITGITYTNIRGTYNATKPWVSLSCSDKVACTNLRFNKIELKPTKGKKKKSSPVCWNAYGQAQSTTPSIGCLTKGFPQHSPEVDQCAD